MLGISMPLKHPDSPEAELLSREVPKLPPLFATAKLFAFPSLWEGFGLPVIEAMACGTPVITLNNSSMPEVAGDAALLVDPYSVEEIESAMTRIILNDSLANDLRQRGVKRAANFTWHKTAEQSLNLYQQFI